MRRESLAAWMLLVAVVAGWGLTQASGQSQLGLSISMTASQARITVTGAAGTACQIQWTDNLSVTSRWFHLGHLILAGSPTPFSDSTSSTQKSRYYRAVWVPSTNMVYVSPGTFTMGDTLDHESDAVPTSATVSAFYMEANLVSWALWQSAYTWATNHGYSFVNAGSGKASNHPVQSVDWYDMVKWCNARSQQEGKTPVYYTNTNYTQVYTNLETTNVFANWAAKGYRLPTEAEWEFAARGGLHGQRFPWGNLINENLANYYGCTLCYNYDSGPDGYNAFGSIGGTLPGTSPVGSFPANGYGLYDMAGNLYERCWDWYGSPYSGGVDPRGPGSGQGRVIRGGSWGNDAISCRTGGRGPSDPTYTGDSNIGFRSVLPSAQ